MDLTVELGRHANTQCVITGVSCALNVVRLVTAGCLPGYSGATIRGNKVTVDKRENSIFVAVGNERGEFELTKDNGVGTHRELNNFLRKTCGEETAAA